MPTVDEDNAAVDSPSLFNHSPSTLPTASSLTAPPPAPRARHRPLPPPPCPRRSPAHLHVRPNDETRQNSKFGNSTSTLPVAHRLFPRPPHPLSTPISVFRPSPTTLLREFGRKDCCEYDSFIGSTRSLRRREGTRPRLLHQSSRFRLDRARSPLERRNVERTRVHSTESLRARTRHRVAQESHSTRLDAVVIAPYGGGVVS